MCFRDALLILLAVGVTQEANDVHQLVPMLERVQTNLEAAGIAGRPRVAVADAGYWSQANAMACAGRPDLPEVLVATTKDWKQRKQRWNVVVLEGTSPRP